jgi:hypothetical protein
MFIATFVGAARSRPQYRITLLTTITFKKQVRWAQRAIKNRPYKRWMFITPIGAAVFIV